MCKGRAKSDRAWISGVAASILAKRRLIARYARPAPGWGLTSTNFWILCTAYAFAFAFTPRKCWFSFYLRTPEARMAGAVDRLGTRVRAKVFRKVLPTVGTLGRGAAGPVFLHVGTTFVEPTDGAAYEPTEGATTDPYPPSPGACASANVLVRVKAVASTIVVSFMSCLSCRFDKGQAHRLFDRSMNSS